MFVLCAWNGSFQHVSAPLSVSGLNLLTPDLNSDGSKQDSFNGVGACCDGHEVAHGLWYKAGWAGMMQAPCVCNRQPVFFFVAHFFASAS